MQRFFLQKNVYPSDRMILTLAAKGSSLGELAEMADRVMEVVSLSITKVAVPQKLLRLKNFSLK